MKYASVNGQRREAQRGLSGVCPACGADMRPRCGNVRVHHWAHISARHCDRWWEPETDWHRAWKDCFPKGWQEIVGTDKTGERHIADVRTDRQWVIEFQHSRIDPDERHPREAFHRRMLWI